MYRHDSVLISKGSAYIESNIIMQFLDSSFSSAISRHFLVMSFCLPAKLSANSWSKWSRYPQRSRVNVNSHPKELMVLSSNQPSLYNSKLLQHSKSRLWKCNWHLPMSAFIKHLLQQHNLRLDTYHKIAFF